MVWVYQLWVLSTCIQEHSHSERHTLILDVEANEFYQNINSSSTADNIGEMLQKLEACLFLLEFKLNTPGQ